MLVYHGYGTNSATTCSDPGIDPFNIGEEGEAALDAEWANALAPSATLIFMSCDDTVDNGIFTSLAALVDYNLADTMSMSYGETELSSYAAGDYAYLEPLYEQAAPSLSPRATPAPMLQIRTRRMQLHPASMSAFSRLPRM
jgi:subtilase family serine protease